MKKFVCTVCGYVYEGEAAPAECPICHAPADKFKEQTGEREWAAEHVVGVAKGVSEDINVCMEHDDSVLCILREYKGRRFFGIFNFSDQEKTAWMQEDGVYRNLLTSEKMELKDIRLRGYDFLWCEK